MCTGEGEEMKGRCVASMSGNHSQPSLGGRLPAACSPSLPPKGLLLLRAAHYSR